MGIPVVASPQAAKGIQATPGMHLLVGDRPEIFAQHVIDLLTKEPLRKKLADAARRHLNHSHNWPSSLTILDQLLAEQDRTGKPQKELELKEC